MSTDENIAIGGRLRRLRGERGLSQSEMAARLGLSLRAYQNYERGERTITMSTIKMLMGTFGVDARWLLIGDSRGGIADAGASYNDGGTFEARLGVMERAVMLVTDEARRCRILPNPDRLPEVVNFVYQHDLDAAAVAMLFRLLEYVRDVNFWSDEK